MTGKDYVFIYLHPLCFTIIHCTVLHLCVFYSVFYLYGAAACQLFIKRICYVMLCYINICCIHNIFVFWIVLSAII